MPSLAAYGKETEEPMQFLGEALSYCSIFAGDSVLDHYMADRLKEEPFNFEAGTQFYVADGTSTIWMQGGFQPLKGGAPWYYSGTPGLENADALIVPRCPIQVKSQRVMLAAIEETDTVFGDPISDDVMTVYPIVRTSAAGTTAPQ